VRRREYSIGQLLICKSERFFLRDAKEKPCLIIELLAGTPANFNGELLYRIICNEREYIVIAEEMEEYPT